MINTTINNYLKQLLKANFIMKTFLSTFKTIAIVIAMLGFGNRAMAQQAGNYELNDGAGVIFNAGTYTGIVTSTTAAAGSTASITTSGTVNFNGTYSGYYGFLDVLSGGTLTLNAASYNAKFTLGSASHSEATTLKIYASGGVTFGTSGLTMDKYGVLDISDNLTLSSSGIQMNNYTDVNAPKIKFNVTGPATTYKITLTTLPADSDPSKNLVFSMASATGTINAESNFIVATYSGADPNIASTSPTLLYDNDNWINTSVNTNAKNLRLTATFAPLFDINSTATSYAGTLTGLSGRNVDLYQKLLKNKTLDAGYTVAANLLIDLQALGLIGGQTFTINSGKMLGLKGTGSFTNTVSFADGTSILQVVGTFAANSFPTIGGSAGVVQVGDGTNATTFTISSAINTKFSGKVSQVVVKSGATVTVGNSD